MSSIGNEACATPNKDALVLTVNFEQYPVLYAFLKETSRIEFRPVENQLLYWLNDIYEQARSLNS